jgi:tRNA U34 5-methylaminomethyl-2-thiouridine-forming methyltransferase MnmC
MSLQPLEILSGVYDDLCAIHREMPHHLDAYWELDALLLDLAGILDSIEAHPPIEKPLADVLASAHEIYGAQAAKALHSMNPDYFPDPSSLEGGVR